MCGCYAMGYATFNPLLKINIYVIPTGKLGNLGHKTSHCEINTPKYFKICATNFKSLKGGLYISIKNNT